MLQQVPAGRSDGARRRRYVDAPAVANREILLMQLLVLRRSSLMEGATNNDGKLNQLMACCWKTILRGGGLPGGSRTVSLSLRTLHRQLKQHTS